MSEKAEIRKLMKERIAALTPNEKRTKGYFVALKFLFSKVFERAKSVFIYRSMTDELSTDYLIKMTFKAEKQVFLPRIEGPVMQVVPYHVGDELRRNEYGIEEPTGDALPSEEASKIDIAIVPLRAFDAYKHRLGRGMGYYDRFLSRFEGVSIGVAFSEQECDHVPVDENDIELNYIVTDKEILR